MKKLPHDAIKEAAIAITEGRPELFSEYLKNAAVDFIAEKTYENGLDDADFMYDIIINGYKGLKSESDREVASQYLALIKPEMSLIYRLQSVVGFSLKSYSEKKLKSNAKIRELLNLYKQIEHEESAPKVKEAIINVINEECDDE